MLSLQYCPKSDSIEMPAKNALAKPQNCAARFMRINHLFLAMNQDGMYRAKRPVV